MHKNTLALCLVILCLFAGFVFAETKVPPYPAGTSVGLTLGKDHTDFTESSFFVVLRAIVFWFSPFLFFAGLLLVNYGSYKKLEAIMTKEIGIRKRIFPKLETNNYVLHDWLMGRNILTGLICMSCALIFFFVFR